MPFIDVFHTIIIAQNCIIALKNGHKTGAFGQNYSFIKGKYKDNTVLTDKYLKDSFKKHSMKVLGVF